MLLRLDGRGPLYAQAYRALRDEIRSGRIVGGARLPSTRALARESGLSRNTVLQAYEQLRAEGYVEGRRGSGTRVCLPAPAAGVGRAPLAPRAEAATPPPSAAARRLLELGSGAPPTWVVQRRVLRCDFRYGEPDYAGFPHATWNRILGRRLRRASRRQLDYGDPGGSEALRRAWLDHLVRTRGVVAEPEQVLITRGAQQALDLLARLWVDPGDRVAVENPGYPGARLALRAAGAELVPVGVDAQGLDLAGLPDGPPPTGSCVTPSHQFPTGGVAGLPRRLRWLEHARDTGAWLIEDDYDSEYRFDARPVECLQGLDGGERVAYVGTLSKVMFPSLRAGVAIVPRESVAAARALHAASDTGCGGVEQLALADFIAEGGLERHVRRSRVRMAQRRAALLDALRHELGEAAVVHGADAGLHVLLDLPALAAARVPELRRRALRADVGVYSAAPFWQGSRPPCAQLLLGYAALEPATIREGVARLAETLRALPA